MSVWSRPRCLVQRSAVLVCAGALWIMCAPGAASAAVIIASYPFNAGSAASTDAEPSTAASNFTTGAFTGGTISGNVAISTSTFNAYIRSSASSATTAAEAVANDDSWQFTVTPDAGVAMMLTSLDFRYGSNSTSSTTSFTGNFVVRSSLDNYASDLGAGVYSKTTTGTTGSFLSTSIDLTVDPLFQSITGPVTFRFFEFDGSTSTGNIARLDDVVLNGTIAVPEPSALLLLAASATALLAGRRARR